MSPFFDDVTEHQGGQQSSRLLDEGFYQKSQYAGSQPIGRGRPATATVASAAHPTQKHLHIENLRVTKRPLQIANNERIFPCAHAFVYRQQNICIVKASVYAFGELKTRKPTRSAGMFSCHGANHTLGNAKYIEEWTFRRHGKRGGTKCHIPKKERTDRTWQRTPCWCRSDTGLSWPRSPVQGNTSHVVAPDNHVTTCETPAPWSPCRAHGAPCRAQKSHSIDNGAYDCAAWNDLASVTEPCEEPLFRFHSSSASWSEEYGRWAETRSPRRFSLTSWRPGRT